MYIYNTRFTDSDEIHNCLYYRPYTVDFSSQDALESVVKPQLNLNHDLTNGVAFQSALFPINVLSLHITPTDKFTLVQTVFFELNPLHL